MKKIYLIFAFLVLLKPVFPVFVYWYNYDYIVQELCENVDKPELACNGKCHLAKELDKAKDNPFSSAKKLVVFDLEPVLLSSGMELISVNQSLSSPKQPSGFPNEFYTFLGESRIFQPPVFI